ncbi:MULTISPECIES: DUF4398 domain-containing protein [unclassified Pseudomonas]|uniref:DUF4398 domain-containing protein n=1 Tax=unclassified Pseudomonas TaxID=196821 RepID=UPI002AC93847|nr:MULTISPECIES: DUF4398 domain-containing protein [unclassified Pseudomonas]MEB0047311.1 DUF4398 domain-containing protein [Pseudomonas sp. Dout3]MEB0096563.1 DUF4398 domain-containing protein [Pseudomonas sp. DC1.2]WPX60316.1 DUF4398 domain-containing protein [Pseudomonas sp. DC1.2]
MNIHRGHAVVRIAAVLLFTVGVATLSACASAPVPDEQITMSKDALNRAISADATQYAPLQMKSAQDKMSQLDRAVGEKDYAKVRVLAQQIEVDANLAERTARTARSIQQLKAAQDGIKVLKQEMLQAPATDSNSSITETF